MKITPEQIKIIRDSLPFMAEEEKRRNLELLKIYDSNSVQEVGTSDFLTFIDHVYPGYKVGPHHRRLAKIFEDIANGKKRRVIVNIAPPSRQV